jgi:hypothetical protein
MAKNAAFTDCGHIPLKDRLIRAADRCLGDANDGICGFPQAWLGHIPEGFCNQGLEKRGLS